MQSVGSCLFGFLGFFGFLVFWFFVFLHTNQKTKKTKNQETKKSKNQKTKKPKKKQKKQDCTPQGEGVRCRVLGLVFLVFLFFLVFCFFGFFTHKPKKQKNKKPRNQKKTKKQKKNKKKQDCTPQGEGVRCRVLGLVFLFFFGFFWFFGFLVFCFFWFFGLCVDSHCRCAKQRLPGTVSGCTRSKVDTLQYSNVCYDIVHSANEQQRGMEFNFVRLRHMLLDLCTGNAAICALPQWPVLEKNICTTRTNSH